jgi:hypothetical protein
VNAKPKHAQARNKRIEKDLLSATTKKSMRVIFKAMYFLNKRSMGLLFREPVHIHIEKHFPGRHIIEHAQLRGKFPSTLNLICHSLRRKDVGHILRHTLFKVMEHMFERLR